MANTFIQSSIPLASTATGAAGAVTATIGATTHTGRCIYVSGFSYQADGATAQANVTITLSFAPVSGAAVTLGTWTYVQGATATVFEAPLVIPLIPPMTATTPITGATNGTTSTAVGSISITATAGAGTTNACLNLWGYAL